MEQCRIKTNTQYPNNKILTLDTNLMSPFDLYTITHDRYSVKIELQTIVGTEKSKKPVIQNKKLTLSYHDKGELNDGTYRISEESNEDCVIIYFDEKI
jgi:hypothetical protein